MQRISLQVVAFVVALIIAATLSSCTGDRDDGGSSPDPSPLERETHAPDPTQTYVDPAETFSAYECPFASQGYVFYPYEDLAPADAEIYEEMPYCTNGQWATLENTGDGVWGIDSSVVYSMVTTSAASDFFRSSVLSSEEPQTGGIILAAPGDVVTVVPVRTIAWAPHYGLTTGWQILEIGLDRLQGYGPEYLEETLRHRTHHSGAVAQCIMEAATAIENSAELSASSDAVDHAQAGLSVLQAGTCPQATADADRSAHAQRVAQSGQLVDELPPVKTSLVNRVHTLSGQLADGADFAKLVDAAPRICITLKVRFCL